MSENLGEDVRGKMKSELNGQRAPPRARQSTSSSSSFKLDWLKFRLWLEGLSLRQATLWMGIGIFIYFFVNVFFLQDSILVAVSTGFGLWLGVWLIAALLASVLALPGWLIRGKYQFKFIMIGFLWAVTAGAIADSFEILALSPVGKMLAIPCIALLSIFVSVLSLFSLFSTLTPERWAPKLGNTVMVISLLSSIGALAKTLGMSPSDRGRKLFAVERSAALKMLAGKAVPYSVMNDELLQFSHANESGRKPSQDLAVLDAPPDFEAMPLRRQPAAAGGALVFPQTGSLSMTPAMESLLPSAVNGNSPSMGGTKPSHFPDPETQVQPAAQTSTQIQSRAALPTIKHK